MTAGSECGCASTLDTTGMRGVHDVGTAGHGGEWHSARETFCGCDDVGDEVLTLAGEPGSGSCDTGLDLVQGEEQAIFITGLA